MYRIARIALTASLFFTFACPAWAQGLKLHDPPKFYQSKEPPTWRELSQRDALYQYIQGLVHEFEDRHIDALKAYQEAAKNDPNSPSLHKAQLPILLALDRMADALAVCQKVVALDPSDISTWYVMAKLYKASAKNDDSIAALRSALKSAEIKDHPEAAQQIYIELGTIYESLDQFGPAADAYNHAAAILEHPEQIQAKAHFVPREAILARAAETYERIGGLYRKAKQYDQAIAALEKARDRLPERGARLNYVLAQVTDEQGKPANALKYLDAYLATQPLSTEPYEYKVRLLRQSKQIDAILPWLEKVAARERFNNSMQLLLAKEYADAKETKKAEAIYQRLMEDSPSADLYRGLFQLYKKEGAAGQARTLAMLDQTMEKASKTDGPPPLGAIQHAKAMVAALREDSDLAKSIVNTAFQRKPAEPELQHETVYFLALMAQQHRKSAEAERFYMKSLAKATPATEPIIYGGLLQALGQQRKHEAMVKICQEGLEKSRTTNPLFFLRTSARANAALQRYDEAIRQTDRAVKQAGDEVRLEFQLLRVTILIMAHRHADAETDCKTLLKTYKKPADIVEIRYRLSNVYGSNKEQAKSEEQLQLILKIDPDNAMVNNDLGYLWADQEKNLAEAEAMIRKALALDRAQRRRNPNLTAEEDKDNAAFVDSLGWVLFRRGQIAEARKELERATTLGDGDDPVIYDHLGDAYQRLKMIPEATRAWTRSLELYEQGARGKDEDRMREIRSKIEQVK